MTTTDLKKTLNLKYEPVAFGNRTMAFNFANRSESRTRVILGEGAYLVVCPRDAEKLQEAGYEYAG